MGGLDLWMIVRAKKKKKNSSNLESGMHIRMGGDVGVPKKEEGR